MGLDDERSKKVAEILGNKTCKKIIDFLADINEASEKDISDALKIPINTVEYNLKKLLDAGLVEKTKNFFWSKKGRKIDLYKLARKHIVISTKPSKPNLTALKTIIPVILSIAIVALLISMLVPDKGGIDVENIDQTTMKTFNSQAELEKFLEENQAVEEIFGIMRGDFATATSGTATAEAATSGSTQKASDYSETNIQVEGVDEPDIVKNDGRYIYVVSGERVVIANAYPAENLEIISEINISGVRDIFINEDKLMVFSNEYKSESKTKTRIYDISDKSNPEIEKEIEIDGYYVTARMINGNVYLIANQYVRLNGGVVLPGVMVDGVTREIAVNDIAYFPYPDTSYTFTNILAIDVQDGRFKSQTYLTGASHTVYISEDNIYLTYSKRLSQKVYFEELVKEVIIPLLPSGIGDKIQNIIESDKDDWEKQSEIGELIQDYSDSLKGSEKAEFDKELIEKMQEFEIELQKKLQVTIVHKININNLDIDYVTNGEVPGTILNQFSMDEYEGNFRITTTTGDTWRDTSLNHLYVLDEDLDIIGSAEGLAKGERIYSTRFIGERAYVVTFRQVDPLFVIDLSDPESPEILGQLKVTGFSSYLHPYDENHIIGIGKQATEEGRVTGVKIALFDVSDVENPIEKARYEVQGMWSDSNALYDHKAFLFDKERELLVLPMSYTKEAMNMGSGKKEYEYWQGAFVFRINKNEITLRGQIDHKENESEQGYYYGPYAIQRSLYMDDVLYTISRSWIKANNLEDLSEINKLKIPYEEIYYRGPVVGFAEGEVAVSSSSTD